MGFLSSLTGGDVGKATDKAATKNKALLGQLRIVGNDIIDRGEDMSAGKLGRATAAFNPYVRSGRDATSMYSNAIGLGGANGTAAAQDAFQAGPGYQFAMDQGTNAALRGASAAGMLNSGNTLTALSQYGQGLANQEYGSWLDRLQGLSSQGLSAASGQAGAYSNQANLYQNTADDRLGLESAVTQGRMGINNQRAQAQEAGAQARGSFLSNLVSGGIGLGTKLLSGGLF